MNLKALALQVNTWLVTTKLGRVVKGFIYTVAALALADWQASGSISLDNWQTWLIVAAAPIASMAHDYFSKSFPLFPLIEGVALANPNTPAAVKAVITEGQDPVKP